MILYRPLKLKLEAGTLPTLSTNVVARFLSFNTGVESLYSPLINQMWHHISSQNFHLRPGPRMQKGQKLWTATVSGAIILISLETNSTTVLVPYLINLDTEPSCIVWPAQNTLIEGEYVASKIHLTEATSTEKG